MKCKKVFFFLLVGHLFLHPDSFSHVILDKKTANRNGASSETVVSPHIKQFIERFLSNDLSGKTIIDIGFGWGAEVKYLSQTNAKHVYAIDPAPEHVTHLISALKKQNYKEVEKKGNSVTCLMAPSSENPDVTIIKGYFPQKETLSHLPLDAWDMVIMSNVIMFMEGGDVENSFETIHDRLSTNGFFLLSYTSFTNLFPIEGIPFSNNETKY